MRSKRAFASTFRLRRNIYVEPDILRSIEEQRAQDAAIQEILDNG